MSLATAFWCVVGWMMADALVTRSLTPKQERFVLHYLGDCRGNAAKAALAAGYSAKSPKVASVVASRLLANVGIRAKVEEILAAEAMPAAEVLQELSKIARADWREFVQIRFDIRGEPVDARIVLGDKVKALELLGKYYGLWVERTETTANVLRIEGLDVRDV